LAPAESIYFAARWDAIFATDDNGFPKPVLPERVTALRPFRAGSRTGGVVDLPMNRLGPAGVRMTVVKRLEEGQRIAGSKVAQRDYVEEDWRQGRRHETNSAYTGSPLYR
jgi:hypothetical protein